MVSSTDIIAGPFTLNGVTVAFAFTFALPGDDTSQIEVIVKRADTGHEDEEVTLTETSHYAVTAVNQDFSNGGTVTITNTVRDLYTSGTITLILNTPFLQESDYQNSDDLPKEIIESDFDKAVYRDLRLLARLDRVLQVPLTDAVSGNLDIPGKTERASKYLGFDTDGQPVAVSGSDGGDALSLDGASKSIDGTLAANSDTKIPTQKAVKTYADNAASIVHVTGAQAVAGVKTFSDGIDSGGDGTALKFKIVDIGDWNMDSSSGVQVAHGLVDHTKIRTINVLIRHDTTGFVRVLPINTTGNNYGWSTTYIYLEREAAGDFDNSSYDATSYNRGWITIWYVP